MPICGNTGWYYLNTKEEWSIGCPKVLCSQGRGRSDVCGALFSGGSAKESQQTKKRSEGEGRSEERGGRGKGLHT
jgi:hypothetical protein